MPPKTLALIAALCLTAGWVLASMLTPPVAKLQTMPERRARQPERETSEAITAGYSEHLKLRLQQAPEPPTPRRNPFRFGARERAPESSDSASRPYVAPPPAPLDAAPVPVGPIYSLSGMAVTETPGGTVRTAVLGDGRGVHLVKSGDVIGGYTVSEITDSSVTLLDASGARYILTLR